MNGKTLASGYLLAGATSDAVNIVVKMRECAGNAYQNASASFDILLRAAQYNYEVDGFNNPDYDKNASWENVECGTEFTITYKTNADVEMGTVTYKIGEDNKFPEATEFGSLFPDFVAKLKTGSSNVTNLWLSGYYTDKDFTSPASMPADGKDHTVYVKLNNNAHFDELQYTSALYTTTYLYDWKGGNGGPETLEPESTIEINDMGFYPNRYISVGYQCAGLTDNTPTIVFEKKNADGEWEKVDDSRFLSMMNALLFEPYQDQEGDYRLAALYYTALGSDGSVLYYDYAEIPEHVIHVTNVY